MGEFQASQPNELNTFDTKNTPETKEEETNQIELNITPRVKEKWGEWLKHCGKNAVALDGSVVEGTMYNDELPAANFNHHQDNALVDATCKQVLEALKSGSLNDFQKDGKPFFRLFMEDCDEDVSTAVALFEMYCEDPALLDNPKLNELIEAENTLDKSAGMLQPQEKTAGLLDQVRWVYEPYQTARRAGKISIMDAMEMKKIIQEINQRIRQFMDNKAGKIEYDGRFKIVGGGADWSLVEEYGNDSRMEMVKQGIPTMLSIEKVPLLKDKVQKYRYAFAVLATETNLPLREVYNHLNEQEKKYRDEQKYGPLKETDSWGGDNIRGGSPRQSHSLIPPEQIQEIINNLLEEKKSKE